MEAFSVLISVYKNEKPEYFKKAIDSILNQTIKPDEVILIRDGKVTDDLQEVIDDYIKDELLFTYIPLEKNVGLGNALKIGIEKSRNELIARMDSDDISVNNRFELQLRLFEQDKQLSIVGGQIEEFYDDESNIVGKRVVPLTDSEIKKFLKKRNPFNHMSVMFKRSEVLKAGNYIELHYLEDYFLWCRMYLNDCRFANVPDTLVYVRTSRDMYKRRGGCSYFKSYQELEKFKYKNKIIGLNTYIINLMQRFFVHAFVPISLRAWIFKHLCRKTIK